MQEGRGPVPEGPQVKAETWFALAVATMMIALCTGVAAAIWVFEADAPQLMVQRAQAFTPFGAAILAIVTFCTVAWRGVLNTQQLEQQRLQLDQQRVQLDQQRQQVQQQIRNNDANDETNLAKLLQEGAKLIGEKEKEAAILGGIATLELLILQQKTAFSTQAMNLLGDFYTRHFSDVRLKTACNAARRALARGFQQKLRAEFRATFEAPNSFYEWQGVRGYESQSYVGGRFYNSGLKNIGDIGFVAFKEVNFENADIKQKQYYNKCTFRKCRLDQFSWSDFGECTFIECDFSSTHFLDQPNNNEIPLFTDCIYFDLPTGIASYYLPYMKQVQSEPNLRSDWYYVRDHDLAAFDKAAT